MTFENAAWAVDGAQMNSALARRAMYSIARQSGIVQKDDLKVQALGSPGNGVVITNGVGVVLNDYQTVPNEVYVVSNPSSHTIPSGEMPASNPSPKSYIVAVVVGDPDFSQTGHPWMGTDDPPSGEELDFDYVRPTLIQVSSGATTLNVDYPALVLARIDIPASTTTITNAMITDLRKLSMSRQEQHAFVAPDTAWDSTTAFIPTGTAFANWGSGQYAPSVDVPSWAKTAIVLAHINGVYLADASSNVKGKVRATIGGVASPETRFDLSVGGGTIRDNYMCGGKFNVESVAGTAAVLRVQGFQELPASPADAKKLKLTSGSQIIFDVRFFEE